MEKLLTVVMPSYNAAGYLPETVPTILASRHLDQIELLIVNDGSKDETSTIGHQFAADYPQVVRVIDKENGGHGSTVNAGIEAARGKYFKVVDADDWVDTQAFDALLDYLEGVDDDLVVSPYTKVYVDSNQEELHHEFQGVTPEHHYTFDELLNITQHTLGMHTMTIKSSILRDNAVRLGEKMFYVDMEYITYPMPYIETVSLFDAPIYRYRLGSVGQSVSLESYLKNRVMHQNVIYRLVSFYQTGKLKGIRAQVVKAQIQRMINLQVRLYLMLPDTRQGKKELLAFEATLAPDFKREAPSKLVYVLRLSHYRLFGLLHHYLKRFKNTRTN